MPASRLTIWAARKVVLGGATWQRCQFHPAQNAIHHAPTVAIRQRISSQLREVWNGKNLAAAEAELKSSVASYRDSAALLAEWLETAVHEALAVLKKLDISTPKAIPSSPDAHRPAKSRRRTPIPGRSQAPEITSLFQALSYTQQTRARRQLPRYRPARGRSRRPAAPDFFCRASTPR